MSYKIIFTLDCVKDFIKNVGNFESIREIMNDGGYDIYKDEENDTYKMTYEDSESHLIKTIWNIGVDELTIALNNAYYLKMRDKTFNIFQDYKLSCLEICAKEYDLYVSRFEFEEFYNFDFENEELMLIDGAKSIAIKKNE